MPTQRWRVTYSRGTDAPDMSQREQIAAWDAALACAGLVPGGGREPARLVLGAPIPAGLTADAELADLFLPDRRTAADLRARLGSNMPDGHRLVGLHDVWVGEPALQGQVAAADYCVDVSSADEGPLTAGDLETASSTLLGRSTIERSPARGNRAVGGNLRPLVLVIRPAGDRSLWMRLRFDPALGTGRPEEVVEAMGSIMGRPLTTTRRHRERLWLKGDSGLERPPPVHERTPPV